MSAHVLDTFDRTLQVTRAWLDELMAELGTDSPHRAWYALTSVLHAVRDRLPLDEVAHLAAQLPLLVRGMYYEGWRPAEVGARRGKHAFFEDLARAFPQEDPGGAEQVATAVFRVLSRRVTPGEVEDVMHVLPAEVRDLWQRALAA